MVLDYLKLGFRLVNKNLQLYLVGLVLSLFATLSVFFMTTDPNSPLSILYIIISVVFGFISYGFYFATPIIFEKLQQKHPLKLKEVWRLTLQSTKRLILPLFLFGTIMLVLTYLLTYIVFTFSRMITGNSETPGTMFKQMADGNLSAESLLISLLSSLFMATLIFAPHFFSLKNWGFMKANIKSFKLSLKHSPFIIVVALGFFIITLPNYFIPMDSILRSVINTVLYAYLSLGTTASALYYLQKRKLLD